MTQDLEPWLEAGGVAILAMGGLWLGQRCSNLPGRWWICGYGVPLILIVLIGLGRNILSLEFLPPFSWLLAGRTEFLLGGVCAACILATPCSRLRTARERKALMGFLAVFVAITSVWPFLAPAFNRAFWKSYVTRVDSDGICHQGSIYSCGPAAAVTALRRLGLPAEEGELAILAHTSDAIGTPSDLLSDAIQQRYRVDGISSRHRPFKSVADLGQGPDVVTLAVIKYGFLVDHYVAVLEVTPTRIVVGDPAQGLRTYSPSEFSTFWRGTGVEIRRAGIHAAPSIKAPRSN